MWTFLTGAPADARRDLRVFSISPNWKSGVLERLSWLTDVMSSEIGVEQRRSVRRWPRRSFEVAFMRTHSQRARLDNFLVGMGREQFMVPLWHEQFALGTPTGDGTTVQFPAGTLKYREFQVNDLVLLSAGDPNTFAVLTVMTVNLTTDRITVRADRAIGEWPLHSRITPLRTARIMDQVTMDNPADRVGLAQLRFELSDADSRFVASWGYCAPLFRYKPTRKEAIKFTYDRTAYVVDFQSGVVDVYDPGNRAQTSEALALRFFGREQVADFRAFLYAARGMAVRFYVPTFTEDLTLAADIPYGEVFTSLQNGFSEYQQVPQESRRIVSFVFKDGRPTIYRKVVGIQPVYDLTPPYRQTGEQFTVDVSIPPIVARDIERISFVVPSRFDQDTFEIFHATDESAAVSASVVVRSSIVEGMPPIECWVTSKPYPLVTEESLAPNAVLGNGRLYSATQSLHEDMTSGAMLTSGEMREILKRYSTDAESMSANATLVAGDLRQILKTYDRNPAEAVTANAKLTSGSMKQTLIRYTADIESLSPRAVLTGGTLT